MTDPTDDLFAGLDQPRPLPAELRQRLAEQLLAGGDVPVDVPLGAELDQRLRATLADPIAATLHGIDAALPLDDELRARLERRLMRRPRRARALLGAAAAAVVVVGAVAVVVASPTSRSSLRHPTKEAAAPRAPGDLGASQTPFLREPGGLVNGPLERKQAVGQVPAPAAAGLPGTQYGATLSEQASAPQALSPSAGPIGGGTTVTLRGAGLASAVAVLFGTTQASFQVLSDSQLQAVTPPAAHGGRVDVVVRLASGATYRYPAAFRYVETESGPRHPAR